MLMCGDVLCCQHSHPLWRRVLVSTSLKGSAALNERRGQGHPKLMTYKKKRQPRDKELYSTFGGVKYGCLCRNIQSSWDDDPDISWLIFLRLKLQPALAKSAGCVLQTRRSSRLKPWQHWRPGWTWRSRNLGSQGSHGIPKDARNHGESPLFFFSRMIGWVWYIWSALISALDGWPTTKLWWVSNLVGKYEEKTWMIDQKGDGVDNIGKLASHGCVQRNSWFHHQRVIDSSSNMWHWSLRNVGATIRNAQITGVLLELQRGTVLHPDWTPWTPWTGPLQDPPKPVIEMNPDLPKQRWEARCIRRGVLLKVYWFW